MVKDNIVMGRERLRLAESCRSASGKAVGVSGRWQAHVAVRRSRPEADMERTSSNFC